MQEKLKVAVITEGHPIDVIGFYSLFRSFGEFDVYIQALETLAADDKNMGGYDTLVFYNLSLKNPDEGTPIRRFSEKYLGSAEQGIFLLHHGMLSYPDWPLWDGISGLRDRRFRYHWNQTMTFDVADPEHAVTKGMESWTMVDEAYSMNEPDESCHVLITTGHPLSLRAVAWTRRYMKSRVFCYASGHDEAAYNNESFREIVRRGILWTARKIQPDSAAIQDYI